MGKLSASRRWIANHRSPQECRIQTPRPRLWSRSNWGSLRHSKWGLSKASGTAATTCRTVGWFDKTALAMLECQVRSLQSWPGEDLGRCLEVCRWHRWSFDFFQLKLVFSHASTLHVSWFSDLSWQATMHSQYVSMWKPPLTFPFRGPGPRTSKGTPYHHTSSLKRPSKNLELWTRS